MCGIVGVLDLQNRKSEIENREALLRAMLGTIRHRGPDQFGVYVFQDEHSGVGLGNARLSIIDLAGGQQPISNQACPECQRRNSTLWIVFNGEIFNYIELRPELERQSHRLSTDSDTEVIVHLYAQYGPTCVEQLNGQFAFALWDEQARSLFIARDRLGVRPFYYTIQDGVLLFASEIKALLADPRVAARLDPIALDQIFTYWSPLAPRTAFQNIHTLPPGHWLLVTPDAGIKIERYWQLSFPRQRPQPPIPNPKPKSQIPDYAHQLRDLLVDATRLRLRADVPVGAYLSGGLDSSTITALIHHYTGNRLETFSVAFADPAFDESHFQREMAAHLGTRHHLITCTHEDIGRVFPAVVWHTEIPILRTAPAPLYLLSQLVRECGFKVVLTGEGADEFLAGYNIFQEAQIRRFWARQPGSTWRPALLKKLYPYIGGLAQGNPAYLAQFFGHGLTQVDAPDYSHAIRWRNTVRTKRFFSPALKAALAEQPSDSLFLPAEFAHWSPLARAQYLEITLFLSEYLLSSQGDRVAMAHSVEGRFPFLDYRVVEFCNRLPPQLKLRGLNEKYLLKQAVRDLLPPSIWQRPKRPYRAPIHRSFFPNGRPLDWVAELLAPAQIAQAGCFDPRAVAGLVKKLERTSALGETDDMALAGLLSTQLVYHQFMAAYHPPAPLNERDDIKRIIRTAVKGRSNE
jgi:asparagine synthase (glutamine-hydrolysing)